MSNHPVTVRAIERMLLLFIFLGIFGSLLATKNVGGGGEKNAQLIAAADSQINLLADVGFYSFSFGQGNRGLFADQSFFFSNPSGDGVRLIVTDCYCTGDKFLGFVVSSTNGVGIVNALAFCEADPLCRLYSEDPLQCLYGGGWCNGETFVTQPGTYNVSIQIGASPFERGTGFVLLQSLCWVPSKTVTCALGDKSPQCGQLIPCCQLDDSCVYSIFQ